ncbi:hypothetical protein SERLADRAFT_393783, partial [Serpula lacrymans var. lacrymans S7.9]
GSWFVVVAVIRCLDGSIPAVPHGCEESASLSTVGIVQGGQRDEQGVISQDESQLNINASEASEN